MSEQSSGIDQVNTSVVQLDQMTQQNAALVEESAAAADSLQQQSRRLADTVATFRIGGETPGAIDRASHDIHAPAPGPAPAHKMAAQVTIRQARGLGAAQASAPMRRGARPDAFATPGNPSATTTAPKATAGADADADWESF